MARWRGLEGCRESKVLCQRDKLQGQQRAGNIRQLRRELRQQLARRLIPGRRMSPDTQMSLQYFEETLWLLCCEIELNISLLISSLCSLSFP